jgi:hypothetical protein
MKLIHKAATGAAGLPLPTWGEGGGEGVTAACYRDIETPHPIPLPMGEGAGRLRD